MKKLLSIMLFGIAAISFTGCYTQIAVQEEENDDSYTYSDPAPIIIIEPAPPPVIIRPIIGGPHPLPNLPQQPVYKTRKPVAPPRSNVRKRDDIRNSGGRNEGRKRNRR
jgi:hypothetical protein